MGPNVCTVKKKKGVCQITDLDNEDAKSMLCKQMISSGMDKRQMEEISSGTSLVKWLKLQVLTQNPGLKILAGIFHSSLYCSFPFLSPVAATEIDGYCLLSDQHVTCGMKLSPTSRLFCWDK